MASQVFLRFKQKAIAANSFSRLFYENMHVIEADPPEYYLKIHKDMCDDGQKANQASIITAVDGITAMALLNQYRLVGFSASISLNTQFFEECFKDDLLKVIPIVKSFDMQTKIGHVIGFVYKNNDLVADCSHTMYFLDKAS